MMMRMGGRSVLGWGFVGLILSVALKVECASTFKLPGYDLQNQVIKEIRQNGLDTYYYKAFASGDENTLSEKEERSGSAGDNSSCEVIREVPEELRKTYAMKPAGLSPFYTKYTEAYSIPVVSSSSVPDAALSRACYVLRFLLADRQDLRLAYYKAYGRVAVIGRDERIEDIPEYGFLDDENFQTGSPLRGLGAVSVAPVSTGAEENLLCYQNDERRGGETDDVLLKSLAIGILNLAAVRVNPTVKDELEKIYRHAVSSGWWRNTNAARSAESYFGEGVQSFFNVNAYAYPADGHHNDINTRPKLRSYDSSLYVFIQNMFTCANGYIKRCNSRGNEAHQRLWMNCHQSGWMF